MNSNQDKPKWWRPRWSVRTLVVLVTLGCAYLACWGPTKTRGVDDVTDCVLDRIEPELVSNALVVMPLVVGVDVVEATRFSDGTLVWAGPQGEVMGLPFRRYYFWFFGYVAKLPYEREV